MKTLNKLLKTWPKVEPFLPLVITIIMLLIASSNNSLSRGFYQILRILVCGVSGYFCYCYWKEKKYNWAWALGIIAVLFNPVAPIELDEDTWKKIDFFVAVVLAGIPFKRRIIKYIIIISLVIVVGILLSNIFQPGKRGRSTSQSNVAYPSRFAPKFKTKFKNKFRSRFSPRVGIRNF
jgi:hypothetical protein